MNDRVFDLWSTFSALRNDGHVLLDQIRGSLSEMRKLHGRLRMQQYVLAVPDGPSGLNPQAILQSQYGLTEREAQVARLLAEGRSNSVIAENLRISPHTARHHTQRVLSKLGVHSRSAAGARIRV